MAKIANWAAGEFYRAKVRLTKDDGTQGRAQSVNGLSGAFTTDDPALTITQIPDDGDGNPSVEIRANADTIGKVNWDGDGDLGGGVAKLHAEGLAPFSQIDIQATGASMDFGEPVTA